LWRTLGIAGEADGKAKYGADAWQVQPLWSEKIRQEWLEAELDLLVDGGYTAV
jgi:hypothetical protein